MPAIATGGGAQGWDAHVHVFDPAWPVVPGHYRPAGAALETIESLSHDHGIGHLVLVQPSVYGTDNRVLLRGLSAGAGRHRGVVVVDHTIDPGRLEAWHDLGVRGIRLNRVSPVGRADDPLALLRRLAPTLARLRWHVQWYVAPESLAELAGWQAALGLPFVLDHLGGLNPALEATDTCWHALERLAAQACWVKLSGWYRLGDVEPYARLRPILQRVAGLFGERLVWASDWPHTSFERAAAPGYASLLAPLRETLPRDTVDAILRRNPLPLYD